MRWLCPLPADPAETRQHEQTLARIDAWWRAFAGKRDDIAALFEQRQQWDLPTWMGQTLQAVHPDLCWEFGPALNGPGHRLVITPESARHLRPMVDGLVKRAPRLQGWEFYGHRPPDSVQTAVAMVQARAGTTLGDARVRAAIGEAHTIDLVWCAPHFVPDDRASRMAAFVATEALLGEETLDAWIGCIDVEQAKPAGLLQKVFGRRDPSLLALDRLKPTVESLAGSILDQLPDRPWWQLDPASDSSGVAWSTYELQPAQAEDYHARSDLLICSSPFEAMFRATLSPLLFVSGRFSRRGETFCYLKIDRGADPGPPNVEERGALEDALDPVLTSASAGCVIGGGTGLRYWYIDLALADLDRAIPLIRQTLSAQAPPRSWLLFHDANLCGEWVGLRDDSPAPPAAEQQ